MSNETIGYADSEPKAGVGNHPQLFITLFLWKVFQSDSESLVWLISLDSFFPPVNALTLFSKADLDTHLTFLKSGSLNQGPVVCMPRALASDPSLSDSLICVLYSPFQSTYPAQGFSFFSLCKWCI